MTDNQYAALLNESTRARKALGAIQAIAGIWFALWFIGGLLKFLGLPI